MYAASGVLYGGEGETALAATGPAAVITCIFLLLGGYLNRRAIKLEEPMLALLRRYTLVWRCWGGMQLANATLAHTDFTEANLCYANFATARFYRPNFKYAQNLHLALTLGTVLQNQLVRKLLTEHQIIDCDFSY